MESFSHFVCLFYALQSAFWPVKGTYYVKPTGECKFNLSKKKTGTRNRKGVIVNLEKQPAKGRDKKFPLA